jgi:hypothetical protein
MAAPPHAERVGWLGRRAAGAVAPKEWDSGTPGIETAIHSSDGYTAAAPGHRWSGGHTCVIVLAGLGIGNSGYPPHAAGRTAFSPVASANLAA